MHEYEHQRALITDLLNDSPLSSESLIEDVRHLMAVGEEGLAFDTMCSWIFEEEHQISRAFYMRLVAAARELDSMRSVERLDELVSGTTEAQRDI